MNDPFRQMTDYDLANEAQSGLRGQGAVVESMRRLREAIAQSEGSTTRLNTSILRYTIALFLVAIIQIVMMGTQIFFSRQ